MEEPLTSKLVPGTDVDPFDHTEKKLRENSPIAMQLRGFAVSKDRIRDFDP